MRVLLSIVTSSFVGVVVLTSIGRAGVIHVPADQSTIQAGVNAAINGDTVLVADGVYKENVKIVGKGIVLTSNFASSGDVQHILKTVIDGSSPVNADTGSCLIVYKGVGTIVQGFTLTGGTGTKWYDWSDGHIFREGGGILTDSTTATIQYNLIVNNSATATAGVSSAGGGGIRCGFGGARILNNVIAYNKGRYGAGVVMFFAPGEVKNNIVWKNSGGQDYGGAGLWIWNGDGSVVANNTIVENSSSLTGGGVSLSLGTVALLNNIIRANTGSSSAQVYRSASGAGSTVDYCNVQGTIAGTGNINYPPLYASTDFLLTQASPCVDSGNPGAANNDVEDGGNPGSGLAPSLGTVRNDMGAYGGPGAGTLPPFTSPRLQADAGILDFGVDSVGVPVAGRITIHKEAWGLVQVDSITFTPTQAGLTAVTVMPHQVWIGLVDTLTIRWTPVDKGTLSATARIYHNDTSAANPITVSLLGTALGGCCIGSTGNVDCDPSDASDISDLSALIDNLYITFTALCCTEEANVDGSADGNIDISDLSALIDYLYISFTPPAACQ